MEPSSPLVRAAVEAKHRARSMAEEEVKMPQIPPAPTPTTPTAPAAPAAPPKAVPAKTESQPWVLRLGAPGCPPSISLPLCPCSNREHALRASWAGRACCPTESQHPAKLLRLPYQKAPSIQQIPPKEQLKEFRAGRFSGAERSIFYLRDRIGFFSKRRFTLLQAARGASGRSKGQVGLSL